MSPNKHEKGLRRVQWTWVESTTHSTVYMCWICPKKGILLLQKAGVSGALERITGLEREKFELDPRQAEKGKEGARAHDKAQRVSGNVHPFGEKLITYRSRVGLGRLNFPDMTWSKCETMMGKFLGGLYPLECNGSIAIKMGAVKANPSHVLVIMEALMEDIKSADHGL